MDKLEVDLVYDSFLPKQCAFFRLRIDNSSVLLWQLRKQIVEIWV